MAAADGSPTAAGAAGMGPAVGPGGLIDTKAYGKLKQFDGKEENWATWCFVARSYFTLLSQDFDHMLDLAENSPIGALAMAKLSEQGRIHARTLYHILAQSMEGKALSILMNVEKLNGFEGWKALVDAYQPDLGGRHTSMLMGIISPNWEKSTEATFLEDLENWEVLVRRYQDQATDVVTSATKIAVLMKYAPTPLRNALRTNSTNMGTDYEKVKKFIRDWLQSGASYGSSGEKGLAGLPGQGQGLAPMDVGAVDYGKGKGKPKGEKGKSKGSKKGDKGGKRRRGSLRPGPSKESAASAESGGTSERTAGPRPRRRRAAGKASREVERPRQRWRAARRARRQPRQQCTMTSAATRPRPTRETSISHPGGSWQSARSTRRRSPRTRTTCRSSSSTTRGPTRTFARMPGARTSTTTAARSSYGRWRESFSAGAARGDFSSRWRPSAARW